MEFASDNTAIVHPKILEALSEANEGSSPSYGADAWTRRAVECLESIFETRIRAFLVPTGTAANALALSAIVSSIGTVFCHREAHINTDECGAPELLTGGSKLTVLDGIGCKLGPDTLGHLHRRFERGFHQQQPQAVSITQATELGQVYSADEMGALGAFCREHGLRLHVDGARFANALVAGTATAAELSWRSGVDVLSFGATKNGAMGVEAVIFFDMALADRFEYRVKRAAQIMSKGRFLGAQMLAYLIDDLWLDNARHANTMARRLGDGLRATPGTRLALEPQANQVFPVMPRETHERLQAAGAHYYEWASEAVGDAGARDGEVMARLVCSYLTTEDEVDELVALAVRGK